MDENTQQPSGINYKINENGVYKVTCKTWNGKTFYNIPLQQRKYDGTTEVFNRSVSFSGCEPPKNGEYIKILTGFESNYQSKKDPYAWITTIVIQNYEISEYQEDALAKYQEQAPEQYESIEIKSEDLPF